MVVAMLDGGKHSTKVCKPDVRQIEYTIRDASQIESGSLSSVS
jgi:hypothetical protein